MPDGDRLGAVIKAIQPKLAELEASLQPGYRMELAGKYESQLESFHSLTLMLVVAMALVFLLVGLSVPLARVAAADLLDAAVVPRGRDARALDNGHRAQHLKLHRHHPARSDSM